MKAGWQIKTFDEIAEVKGGKRLPKDSKLQSEKTEYPYITVSDFNENGTIDLSKIRFITHDIFQQIKRYTISAKDIYISIAGTIGKTGRVPSELDGASLTENACKLVLKQNVERDFIYYFTESQDFFTQAGLNTRTTAQPKLALERLKTIRLSIPDSLKEQQRIVAILDQAFEGIAKARANAEQNRQNARALFESHLQSVFTKRGKGWVNNKLDSLTTKIGSGATPRGGGESYKAEGISLVRSMNVHDFGFKYAKLAFLDDAQAKELSNVELKSNDVLLNITGASVARCCIVPENVLPARVNQHVSIIRPIPEKARFKLFTLPFII